MVGEVRQFGGIEFFAHGGNGCVQVQSRRRISRWRVRMTFLDSNVLVYAVDARDAGKQKIAKAIVMSARDSAEDLSDGQTYSGILAVNPFRQ